MRFSKVLQTLYAYDIDEIIRTVNSSVFALDYPFYKEDCFIIHTGFIFEMQNGREMELFYDFKNSALIRQPKFSENPPVLGLIYHFWNEWIKVWDHKIVLSVNEIDDEVNLTSFDNADDVFQFDTFKLITTEPSNEVTINGLTKRLEERLWFNGDKFEEIIEDEE